MRLGASQRITQRVCDLALLCGPWSAQVEGVRAADTAAGVPQRIEEGDGVLGAAGGGDRLVGDGQAILEVEDVDLLHARQGQQAGPLRAVRIGQTGEGEVDHGEAICVGVTDQAREARGCS